MCILGCGSLSYDYHQKIAPANKCELGTDLSPQLLLLIYPATLSNVDPVQVFERHLHGKTALGGLRGPPQHVCIYFTLT